MVGGNLAEMAAANGWAGVVVDGCVRDVAELAVAPVGIRARRDGDDLIVALHVNVIAGSIDLPWDRLLASPPVPISLEIDGTWTASDAITGKPLGTANKFAISVPLDRPVMVRLTR